MSNGRGRTNSTLSHVTTVSPRQESKLRVSLPQADAGATQQRSCKRRRVPTTPQHLTKSPRCTLPAGVQSDSEQADSLEHDKSQRRAQYSEPSRPVSSSPPQSTSGFLPVAQVRCTSPWSCHTTTCVQSVCPAMDGVAPVSVAISRVRSCEVLGFVISLLKPSGGLVTGFCEVLLLQTA